MTTAYPQAWPAAQKLYAVISQKPVDTPFAMRRAVVKLFKAFDDQMTAWHLPVLHGTEFVTVQSVLSERQERLEVRQLFDVYHSDLLDKINIPERTLGYIRVTVRMRLSYQHRRKRRAMPFQRGVR